MASVEYLWLIRLILFLVRFNMSVKLVSWIGLVRYPAPIPEEEDKPREGEVPLSLPVP
jgi:hypothetical protein